MYATDTPVAEFAALTDCAQLVALIRDDPARPVHEQLLSRYLSEALAAYLRGCAAPSDAPAVCRALGRSAQELAEDLWREVDRWVPPAAVPSTMTSLWPDTAEVGGPEFVLHVYGTGFTAASRILWNGAEEPTVYVSPTELTTVVKPSTASGPWLIPVGVTGAAGACSFQFTEEDA